MSDDFALMKAVHEALASRRPPLAEGMGDVVQRVRRELGDEPWRRLDGFDWPAGEEPWVKWMQKLLRRRPLPQDTAALWFETPDILLNPAQTSVSAYNVFDLYDEACGFDDGRTWPEDRRGLTLKAGLHRMPEFDAALKHLRWERLKSPEDRELLEPGIYALVQAYTLLLVVNGLPRAGVAVGDGLAVTIGFVDGDVDLLGRLTPGGWEDLRRPSMADRRAKPSKRMLDPDAPEFDPDAYVHHGGDINARDEDGQTVLMRQRYSETEVIRRVVALGADVNALDSEGEATLSYFVGGDAEALEALLQAGADVAAAERVHGPLIALAAGSGLCTSRSIELLLQHGASRATRGSDGEPILYEAAWSPCHNASEATQRRELLEALLRVGCDINEPNSEGRTPLWRPLIAYIEELDDIKGWSSGRFRPDPGTVYFSGFDRTARILLDLGADPNARLASSPHKAIPAGATPLMIARYDNPALHEALLKHGADSHAVSAEGKSALDYARAAAKSRRYDREGAATVVEMVEKALARDEQRRGHVKI